MLESNFSVSDTNTNELNLLGVALSFLFFSWKYQYGIYFPESKITPRPAMAYSSSLNFPGAMRHTVLGAQLCFGYLWLLVMTGGIPLVALCVQPDGGPQATGGTEPEDEP